MPPLSWKKPVDIFFVLSMAFFFSMASLQIGWDVKESIKWYRLGKKWEAERISWEQEHPSLTKN